MRFGSNYECRTPRNDARNHARREAETTPAGSVCRPVPALWVAEYAGAEQAQSERYDSVLLLSGLSGSGMETEPKKAG